MLIVVDLRGDLSNPHVSNFDPSFDQLRRMCKWNHGFCADDAFHHCGREDTSAFPDDLLTLLQMAPREQWRQGLACAMQALHKVFDTSDESSPGESQAIVLPIQISLSQAVGPQTFNLNVESLAFPDVSCIQQLTRPWAGFSLQQDVFGLPLHEATSTGLALSAVFVPFERDFRSLVCQLYVDGSCKDGRAAWSVVVVYQAFHTMETFFGGVFGDILHLPQNPGWLGERELDPLHAEQAAICFALLWIMQAHQAGYAADDYQIHFDSTTAGFGSCGRQALPKSSGLSLTSRGLVLAVENYLQRRIVFQHVSSHEGHAWNELADVVAKFSIGVVVATSAFALSSPPREAAWICRQLDWHWAWTYWDRRNGLALPQIRGTTMSWAMQEARSQIGPDDLIPTQPRWSPVRGCTPSFNLRVVSANMQSLHGKHRLLEEQLVCNGVQIAFLQETKCPGGFTESFEFWRLASEPAHSWGVAVWFRKWLWTSTGRHHVHRQDLAQVASGPRHLVASLALPGCRILAASVHLPQLGRGDEEKDEVYEAVRQCMQAANSFDVIVLGCDANARVPPAYEAVTGGLLCGDPDDAGWRFVEFLHSHGLFLPSTWHELHHGDSVTWRHAKGAGSRIDYVAVGGRSGVHSCISWIDSDFDMMNSNDDHFPAFLQCSVSGRDAGQGERSLRRVQYDRLKLLSPQGQHLLAVEMERYCPPPWHVHPDDHATDLQLFLRDILERHFLVPSSAPRSRYIADDVWSSRQRCQAVKKRTRCFRDTFAFDVTELAFRHWKGHSAKALHRALLCVFLKELFGSAVGFATKWAKERIKTDRMNALHQWLATLRHLPGYKILQALKRFGLGGRKH